MKFFVKSGDLKNILLNIISVVPSKTTLPILGNVLFSAKGESLYLTATDLEVTIQSKVPVNTEKEGGVALPGKIICDIIRQLPDIPLDVTVDKNYRAKIKTEMGEYIISGENETEFPEVPEVKIKNKVEVESSVLERMIHRTLFAVASEEIKSAISGIYLQFLKDELRVVSTDGHRLAKIVNKGVKIEDNIGGFITSSKALNQFIRNKTSDGKVQISLSDNYIIFDFDNYVIHSRIIEGMYPDYERVIPKENKNRFIINRELMESSVKRISIFANKINQQIKLHLSKNSLEISAEDVDYGKEGREKIPAEYGGEEMTIGYNAGYILDILGNIDTEKVMFDFDTPLSAGLVYPSEQKENEELLMLVMPIKLSD